MFLKQHPLNQHLPSQAGYTLLEGLMAVVVVSVMLLAIGPVIAFSVGTRVQAKRVELATQAAKSYIDKIKSGEIEIDNPALPFKTDKSSWLTTSPPANASLKCDAPTSATADQILIPCTTPSDLYCMDVDGGGCDSSTPSITDMVVQGIIYDPTAASTIATTKSYQLAVRVYRANSFGAGITLKTPTADNPLKSNSLVTNAVGDRTQPLVVMMTDVSSSDANFQNLKERIP
ncbi:hormogonium polysaccharide secretion pseudopilin HpsB [Planktothrix sp. FACHB-1365]|uniref:hormogonium polysaccharide secretion pseudopilin HpsB n=1 Tax=Planktothrix sp. FACHB-1365 TaxID=2692855 RepID=UPI00168282EB|nr:hormogonium polysaccharide secretion pseudopilin HpsB [Planktothrix sp. FACHB-1365]MBD2485431.1 type II secretion system protein [Planktothrix sp. FACHB-1365]